MEDLLTTREVLEYLKVDRITVYRMQHDGRLKGVKIGQHWRFPRSEVERLLAGNPSPAEGGKPEPSASFPTHCVQTIQDLFSEISQMNALVIDLSGEPLTEMTHSCTFCNIILQNPQGLQACSASWQALAQSPASEDQPFTCHAGLQYVSTPILDQGSPIGSFVSGQVYWETPDPRHQAEHTQMLAETFGLDTKTLHLAAASVQTVAKDQQSRVAAWPGTAARAVQSILHERTGFMTRLQQISDLTQIP
jgi:excisionase family DNA binding protein